MGIALINNIQNFSFFNWFNTYDPCIIHVKTCTTYMHLMYFYLVHWILPPAYLVLLISLFKWFRTIKTIYNDKHKPTPRTYWQVHFHHLYTFIANIKASTILFFFISSNNQSEYQFLSLTIPILIHLSFLSIM